MEQLWLELEPRPGAPQLLSCRPEQLAQQLPLAAGAAVQLTVTVTAEHDFVLQTEDEEGGERGGVSIGEILSHEWPLKIRGDLSLFVFFNS